MFCVYDNIVGEIIVRSLDKIWSSRIRGSDPRLILLIREERKVDLVKGGLRVRHLSIVTRVGRS